MLPSINHIKHLQDLDEQERKLAIDRALTLNKAYNSGDVNVIYKAEQYYNTLQNRSDPNYASANQSANNPVKALILDPQEGTTSMGYYDKSSALSDHGLRQMARTPVISAIIRTRCNQIADFLKPQPDKYSKGFLIRKKGAGKDDKLTDNDKRVVEMLTEFMMRCGEKETTHKWDKFDIFGRKLIADSLILDKACFEIVPYRSLEPYCFVAVDAATMMIADSYDNETHIQGSTKVKGEYPSYVQLWQNRVIREFYPWEMCFGIRNPSTNIRLNGYGRSELEDLITNVTGMLNADQYNSGFFRQGSAPKGMLMVKKAGAGLNGDRLAEFRKNWNASLSGVGNAHKTAILDAEGFEWIDLQKCLDRSTKVISKTKGSISFEELLGDSKEVYDELWDGNKFSKAHIFITRPKELCEVELQNKLKIKSSPNHRFLCLRNNQATWIEQKDLTIGDLLFINKKIDSTIDSLKFKEFEVEEDLMELMGWILGDGSIGDDLPSKRTIQTFYHPEKELDIRSLHKKVCAKYGINFTEHSLKRIIGTIINGFKTNYSEYPTGAITDTVFYKWYRSLGFNTSREKKVIPGILFQLPSKLKCAFLRGFFSADGHISKSGLSISIAISNDNLRYQTGELLLSEGIRCNNVPSFKRAVTIQDTALFMKKVNFIQQYKRDREIIRTRNGNGKDFYPTEFVRKVARDIKAFNKSSKFLLSKKDLSDLLNISKGHNRGSLSKVLQYGNKINFPHQLFIDGYYLSPVISLSHSDVLVEMVDVEMDNDDHAFYANGFIVHNSNRDMEFFKYIEYLVKVGCAVFNISPEEIGFPLEGQGGGGLGGSDSGKEEKEYSKDKGLKPLLTSLQGWINDFIIGPKTNNTYEFVFTGIQTESAKAEEERLLKAVDKYITPDEIRKERGLKPLPDGLGAMPLSPIMAQMKMVASQQQQGQYDQQQEEQGQQDQQEQDQFDNTNPFLDKGEKPSPFVKAFDKYVEKELILK